MTGSNQPVTPSTFRLRRRTPGSFLLVPCPQQNRSIRCQGQLEGMAATILVACPAVAHIQEQPLTIWYQWREQGNTLQIQLLESAPTTRPRKQPNEGVSYIVPDFLIEMTDGCKRLVEIKPSDRLAKPITQRKLEVARQFAVSEGWTFHLVTEKELLRGPLLANLQLIGRYRQAVFDPALLRRIRKLVVSQGISLGELCGLADETDPVRARTHVFHLLAVGALSFDPLQEPISDQTLIFPGGEITWDPFDWVWAPSGCSTGGLGVWSANSPPIASSPKTPNSS
jgi:hypothetical protein